MPDKINKIYPWPVVPQAKKGELHITGGFRNYRQHGDLKDYDPEPGFSGEDWANRPDRSFGFRGAGKITHNGVDLRARAGAEIRSICNGEVVYAGDYGGYGNVVVIRSVGWNYLLYAHLAAKMDVAAGEAVRMGDPIGRSGEKGVDHNFVPHLHLELRSVIRHDRGERDPAMNSWRAGTWFYLDPMQIFLS